MTPYKPLDTATARERAQARHDARKAARAATLDRRAERAIKNGGTR